MTTTQQPSHNRTRKIVLDYLGDRGARLAKADIGPKQARASAAPSPLLRQGAVLASAVTGLVLALVIKADGSGLGDWSHHHRPFLLH